VASDQTYDYIHTIFTVTKATPPILTTVTAPAAGRGILGIYDWIVTFVYKINDLELESVAGTSSGAFSVPILYVNGGPSAAKVGMTIPLGTTGTTKRRIYRSNWANTRPVGSQNLVPWWQESKYYLVAEVADNTTTTFYDDYPIRLEDRQYFNEAAKRGSIWWGYDFATKSWRNPIVDDGVNQTPNGRILEVTPVLRFVNPNNREETREFSILDMIGFFGGATDFDLERFIKQWQPVFTLSQRLTGEWEGLNYRIGDTVLCPKNYYGAELIKSEKLVIVSADIKITEDKSELEMASL
jgi:hypothetical protein